MSQGDLWLFPPGVPHSIQGLGPDGCRFLLVFDNGNFDESHTFLLTDFLAHTPKEVLAKNFNVPPATFDKVPKKELFIFQAGLPGPLSAEQTQAAQGTGTVPHSVDFKASTMKPTFVETNPSRRPSAKQTRTCTLDRLGCINQAHCIAR
ncbi:MAG: cupin domain-containing protein [Bryobacteraceae bacterium]